MKLIFAFLALVSSSAFAEPVVELVISQSYADAYADSPVVSRVKITKRIYDLTKSGKKIEFICKYTPDRDVSFGISDGQIYVRHKKLNRVHFCETAVNCKTKKFEDLAYHNTLAGMDLILNGPKLDNYIIQSKASWEKRRAMYERIGNRNWSEIKYQDIPEIEIYAPSIHGSKMPVNENGFLCAIPDGINRVYIEP